jgi:hypothetical protein
MTRKTLKDCAKCDMISRCDAHVTNGEWKHSAGIDPCELTIECPPDAALRDCKGCQIKKPCHTEMRSYAIRSTGAIIDADELQRRNLK